MKKTFLAAIVAAAAAAPGVSFADLSVNIGAVSDYRYRGISQSRLDPALQGGADFSAGGFYIGTWASTIKWIKDWGGSADVEIDIYGGYKGEIGQGFGFDVGVLQYWYPDAKTPAWNAAGFSDPNTTEIYGALTFGPATLKYSHAVSDTFGNPDSNNSFYVDASATFEAPWGLAITPHIGYQRLDGPAKDLGSYTDYSITVSKEFVKGLTGTLAAVGTDADEVFYASPKNGKFLGKNGVVVGLKYVHSF